MKSQLKEILTREHKAKLELRYKQAISHWHLLAFSLDPKSNISTDETSNPEITLTDEEQESVMVFLAEHHPSLISILMNLKAKGGVFSKSYLFNK